MNNLVAWLNGKKTIIGIVLTFILLMLPYLAIPQVHAILVTYAMFYQIALKMSAGLIGVGVWHKLVKLTNLLGGAADVDKPDPAGEGAQSGSPASSDPGTVAKLLLIGLIAASLLSFGAMERCRADSISTPEAPAAFYHIGLVDGWLPLQHVDFAPYLSALNGTGKISDAVGADMKLLAFPRTAWQGIPADFFAANFGAATSSQLNGMAYGSVSFNVLQVITQAPTFLSYVSFGYSRDFATNNSYLVIGTAIPINLNVVYNFFGVATK